MATDANVSLQVSMEVDNVEAKIQAVMDGMGVAPLGMGSVSAAVAAGQLALLQVEGFPFPMPWLLVYRKGELSPAAQRFRSHLLQFLPNCESVPAEAGVADATKDATSCRLG
jgi:DNA-binding transcriptional LysR family regulator